MRGSFAHHAVTLRRDGYDNSQCVSCSKLSPETPGDKARHFLLEGNMAPRTPDLLQATVCSGRGALALLGSERPQEAVGPKLREGTVLGLGDIVTIGFHLLLGGVLFLWSSWEVCMARGYPC